MFYSESGQDFRAINRTNQINKRNLTQIQMLKLERLTTDSIMHLKALQETQVMSRTVRKVN